MYQKIILSFDTLLEQHIANNCIDPRVQCVQSDDPSNNIVCFFLEI